MTIQTYIDACSPPDNDILLEQRTNVHIGFVKKYKHHRKGVKFHACDFRGKCISTHYNYNEAVQAVIDEFEGKTKNG